MWPLGGRFAATFGLRMKGGSGISPGLAKKQRDWHTHLSRTAGSHTELRNRGLAEYGQLHIRIAGRLHRSGRCSGSAVRVAALRSGDIDNGNVSIIVEYVYCEHWRCTARPRNEP